MKTTNTPIDIDPILFQQMFGMNVTFAKFLPFTMEIYCDPTDSNRGVLYIHQGRQQDQTEPQVVGRKYKSNQMCVC